MSVTAKKPQPEVAVPARLAYERTSEVGYDVGLHGDPQVGPVDVGLSVDGKTGPLTVGVSLQAPGIGHVLLGLVADETGLLQVAALTREHEGRSWATPPVESEPWAARVAKLEADLAQERSRAARAEMQRAEARVETASGALDPLASQAQALEAELLSARAELAAALELRDLAERSRAEASAALAEAHAERAEAQRRVTEGSVAQVDAAQAVAEAEQRSLALEAQLATTSEELGNVRRDWLQTVDEREALRAQLLIFQDQLTAWQNARPAPVEPVETAPVLTLPPAQPRGPWEPEATETGIPALGAPERAEQPPVDHQTEEFHTLDPTWPGRDKL